MNVSNLMENEIASNIKCSLTIKKIKAYRLFTRVLYLSAICNENGNKLEPKLIKYSTSTNKNVRLTWPIQPKPAGTF